MPKAVAVNVVQDATDEVTTEVLATAIRDIAVGVRALRKAPGALTDRALFLLVRDAAPNNARLGLKTIRDVFTGIENLERLYVRPK